MRYQKRHAGAGQETIILQVMALTTLAKLSVDVSDVISHELSRKGL